MKKHLPRYSIRNIFTDNNNWERYKLNHPELDSYIIEEVERMLDCCNPKKGFFVGHCKHCDKDVIMCIRCNGKVCSRCGRSYADKWVKKAKRKVANELHRLVTLTVPADLRPILKNRWDLLKILQDSAHEALVIVAKRTLKRKKVKLGMLVGLQTYGQDIKFHPHPHCMVLEKAYCKGEELNFSYIQKTFLRRIWRNTVVKNLCKAQISYEDKQLVQHMLDKYPNGFVTDVGGRSMNRASVIRYLARYIRHPAMADSRILFYGKGRVTIGMKDKQKKPYSIWFTVDEFITRLIQHIPPKNFKVVRWYGVYSRREVRLTREKSKQESMPTSSEIKRGKIKCPKCKCALSDIIFFPAVPPNGEKLKEKMNYWLEVLS